MSLRLKFNLVLAGVLLAGCGAGQGQFGLAVLFAGLLPVAVGLLLLAGELGLDRIGGLSVEQGLALGAELLPLGNACR